MKYLNLIRYKNLLMIALMQLIILYGFLKLQNIDLALAIWQYFLLITSTVCIAAGGYIINDVFDQNTDTINKPNHVGFTLVGVCIGFYLSNLVLRPNFLLFFILPSALLYIYATSLKQMIIVGNIIVAAMLSFSIIIIGIFMILPAIDEANKAQMHTVISVLSDFAVIAFIINFIREIVKDLEDIKGDHNQGMQTLPIIFGISRTTKLVFGLSFIPLICILYYIYNYMFELTYATLYILGFIIGPLLYFTIKIWPAKTQKDFHHLSSVLKLVIFFGIIAIAVIGLNMKYYAA
jgi:4-hydroxybenzoate polyprenyltransferase